MPVSFFLKNMAVSLIGRKIEMFQRKKERKIEEEEDSREDDNKWVIYVILYFLMNLEVLMNVS